MKQATGDKDGGCMLIQNVSGLPAGYMALYFRIYNPLQQKVSIVCQKTGQEGIKPETKPLGKYESTNATRRICVNMCYALLTVWFLGEEPEIKLSDR